jgi:hypothetical protein
MNSGKYSGLDVHPATISVVLDSAGKLVMESILETKAASILEFSERRTTHDSAAEAGSGVFCDRPCDSELGSRSRCRPTGCI